MEKNLTLKNKSKVKLLAISSAGVLAVGLCITGVIILKSINDSQKKTENSKVVVENVSNELVQDLSSQLVYSSSDTGEGKYYSPSLDALFTYPKDKFSFQDSQTSVTLDIKNNKSFNIYTNIRFLPKSELKGGDLKAYWEKYYKSIYPETQIIETSNKDGVEIVSLKYPVKDSLNAENKIEIVRDIYSKEIGDKYVVLNFQHPLTLDVTSLKDEFVPLLNKMELSPKDIQSDVTVKIDEPKLQVSFDKKKWNIDNQSVSGFALSFRNKENETNDVLKKGYTSFSLTSGNYNKTPLTEDKVKAKLNEAKAFQIEFNKEKNNEFKILTEEEKNNYFGIDFYSYSYSRKSFDSVTYSYSFYGFDTRTNSSIEIKINTNSPESEGYKESIKLLSERIKFAGESEGNLNYKLSSLNSSYQFARDDTKSKVLGTSSAEVDKSAILGKPAVVHIFNRTCVDIKVKQDKSLKKSGGKEYSVCSAGFGTGFFVNKDGYLITNSHVSKPNLIDTVVASLGNTDNAFLKDFGADVVSILSAQSIDPESNDELYGYLVNAIVSSTDEGVLELKGKYENYIEGTEKFDIDVNDFSLINAKKHFKAKLIDGNDIDSFNKISISLAKGEKDGIRVPDITLLKIEPKKGEQFPALQLADPELINPGQSVQAIGFPGAADNQSLFSSGSSLISTITKGNISAVKPNFNSKFNLIQIDASISPGNSGGPLINADGDVIGVATYGVSQEVAADFNAGVSVAEVVKMLDKNKIKNDTGDVSEYIESGIDNFGKEYYELALADFNNAKKLYSPASDVLNPLIKISEAKIENGEDKTPAFSFGDIHLSSTQVIIISLLLCLGFMGIFIVSLILIYRTFRKKK